MHPTTVAISNPLRMSFPPTATTVRATPAPINAGGTGCYGQPWPWPWSMTQEGVYLERRYRIAKMLSALLEIINRSHALAPLLDYIVAQAELLLDATACALYHLDNEYDALALQSSWGLPTGFTAFARMSLVGKPTVKVALTENRPLVIPPLVRDPLCLDVTSPSSRQMLFASGAYATLVVPLTVHDERYGALLIYFVDPVEFTAEDLALAMTFGRKAACAIESALAWQAEMPPIVATKQETDIPARNGRMYP